MVSTRLLLWSKSCLVMVWFGCDVIVPAFENRRHFFCSPLLVFVSPGSVLERVLVSFAFRIGHCWFRLLVVLGGGFGFCRCTDVSSVVMAVFSQRATTYFLYEVSFEVYRQQRLTSIPLLPTHCRFIRYYR